MGAMVVQQEVVQPKIKSIGGGNSILKGVRQTVTEALDLILGL